MVSASSGENAYTHRRMQGNESLDDSQDTVLKEWAAIRDHLKRHDDKMIGDYEYDIDTMLVFVSIV
jgi:hypothetical protein